MAGLEVAHPDAHVAAVGEREEPPQAVAAQCADVAAEEAHDPRLARLDDGQGGQDDHGHHDGKEREQLDGTAGKEDGPDDACENDTDPTADGPGLPLVDVHGGAPRTGTRRRRLDAALLPSPASRTSGPTAYARPVQLSVLLGAPLLSPNGEAVGKLDDLVVRLSRGDYPLVTGLVAVVGHRRVFVPYERVAQLGDHRVLLTAANIDLRSFERREGEVLLRHDVLGHRLIDVPETELVKASDVILEVRSEGCVAVGVDTRRPARWLGLRPAVGGTVEDWKNFEPLIGHQPSATARGVFGRLRRLKPAQIADLIEDASRQEGNELIEAVHGDPELEADVFEELDPDTANRFFGEKSDGEVADVLTHMRPDDAADAITNLPQGRRQVVLNRLPAGTRTKLMMLLGYNSSSAGGLMNLEFVTCPTDAHISDALRRLRAAQNAEPQALTAVHVLDAAGRLVGVASLTALLVADPDSPVGDVMDDDPVRVGAQADVVDIALLMADYNLLTVPVVDRGDEVLGIVTVDDVLEAIIPEDWRRREPQPRPTPSAEESQPGPAATAPPG